MCLKNRFLSFSLISLWNAALVYWEAVALSSVGIERFVKTRIIGTFFYRKSIPTGLAIPSQ